MSEPAATVISQREFTLVSTVTEAQRVVREWIMQVPQIMVDLEGDLNATGRMSLLTVEAAAQVFLFDILVCPGIMKDAALRTVLQGGRTVKVMHDCRHDSEALAGQYGIALGNVFDTQCAHAVLCGNDPKQFRKGLNDVLARYSSATNPHKDEVKHRPGLWERRPLTQLLLRYAAADVSTMPEAYFRMCAQLQQRGLLQAALTASNDNVRQGQAAAARKNRPLPSRVSDPAATSPAAAAPAAAAPAATSRAAPASAPAPVAAASTTAAWLDRIAAYLAAEGEQQLTSLGGRFPRPPGALGKLGKLLSADLRFAVAGPVVRLAALGRPGAAMGTTGGRDGQVPGRGRDVAGGVGASGGREGGGPDGRGGGGGGVGDGGGGSGGDGRRRRLVGLNATALAFWEHLTAAPEPTRLACGSRAGFGEAYSEWKRAHPDTASGGISNVLFRC